MIRTLVTNPPQPAGVISVGTSWVGTDQPEVISLTITAHGVEVVLRRCSNLMLMTHPMRPKPDEVWREVYEVKGGALTLVSKVYGTHVPAHEVKEAITFPVAP